MKKWLVCIAMAVFVLLVYVGFFLVELASATDPYLIEPLRVVAVHGEVQEGYRIDNRNGTLSVLSRNAVVIVADPGVSFHYIELWLVKKEESNSSDNLREYTFEFPKFASANHIHSTRLAVPEKIRKTAEGRVW